MDAFTLCSQKWYAHIFHYLLKYVYILSKNNKYLTLLGHVNIAKTLLNHGADIDAKTNNNQTALLVAIQNGNYFEIIFLFEINLPVKLTLLNKIS